MPVHLDIESRDHHLFREVERRGDLSVLPNDSISNCINIGIVNNMPDAALVSTERQLFGLLSVASPKALVRLRFYALPRVPRTDWGRQYVDQFYRSVEMLWRDKIDALIVTGSEPRAPALSEEPYWASFVELVDWAKENTLSVAWSCLAVHGAVLYLDGIERQPLKDKCIGVFTLSKSGDHHLLGGVPSRLTSPHSRWNEVNEKSLLSRGYRVITKSADAGVDMFAKRQKNSLFVYFQGHPEYDAQSLLGEYRRDIGRFLRGEVAYYPNMPKGYFDVEALDLLFAFQKRAVANRRADLLASFPIEQAAANLKNTWRAAAACIYQNWISYITSQARKTPVSNPAACPTAS